MENLVRCSRCYQVFDPAEGACPECGNPYKPKEPPPVVEGLYTDRYAGTEFAPPPPPPAPVVARRRYDPRLLIGGGAALIGLALVVAIIFALGGSGGTAPAQPPIIVAAPTSPPPTPTLAPSVASTLAQLNDPNLSAAVSVVSHVQVAVVGFSKVISVKFDGQVSDGNQQGILQGGGTSREIRVVDGHVYTRILPSGKWSTAAFLSPYLAIYPVFGMSSSRELQLVGQETRNGQVVNHLRSTGWWNPDLSRMAMTDLSAVPIKPTDVLLDLWATPDGAPVEASFSATNLATSGEKLLDIEATYTFSAVGVPVAIGSPGPSAAPTPSYAPPPSQ